MTPNSVTAPLITSHPFSGGHDDFRCNTCNNPRALHANDGFTPIQTPHSVTMDDSVHYGQLNPSDRNMGFTQNSLSNEEKLRPHTRSVNRKPGPPPCGRTSPGSDSQGQSPASHQAPLIPRTAIYRKPASSLPVTPGSLPTPGNSGSPGLVTNDS